MGLCLHEKLPNRFLDFKGVTRGAMLFEKPFWNDRKKPLLPFRKKEL